MTAGWRSRRGAVAGLCIGMAVATALVLGLTLAGSTTDFAGADGDIDDDQVVAVLTTTRAAYSNELRDRLNDARNNPDDAAAAKVAARRLIDEGRAAGDTRLVGAGLGVLRPFIDRRDDEVLLLAATARQYQHDFSGALGLLDEAIAIAPGNTAAILTRATVNTVLGEYDAAADDCRGLGAKGRIELMFLCQSTLRVLTVDATVAYERLGAVAEVEGFLDANLRTYALSLMGEIAMLQGWPERARKHFEAVLTADPNAVRDRMMLADVSLAAGDHRGALAALAGAPEVDGVVLRRAIAAAGAGDAAAAAADRAELERRFRLNLDLGLTSHAREETRYFLEVAPDPKLALARAKVNWGLQREFEDAQLLIDAAAAAGEPAEALPVLRWIEAKGVAVPTLRIPDAVREATR